MAPPPTLEKLFLAQLPTIDAAIDFVARRNHLRAEEKEEFAAEVRYRMIADDYGILRRHGGASSLDGYLRICIQNLWTSCLRAQEGRFRPSAEADRLGRLAAELETLLVRERRGLGEACDLLEARHQETTRQELEELAERLPQRIWRKIVGEEELGPLASPIPDALERLEGRERIAHKALALDALHKALAQLGEEERQLVLLPAQGVPISQIARSLKTDDKRLYRTRQRTLDRLRRDLKAAEIRWEILRDTLGADPEAR
jgi:DNA-directed RNA polymerase specialized sigma24 family protein